MEAENFWDKANLFLYNMQVGQSYNTGKLNEVSCIKRTSNAIHLSNGVIVRIKKTTNKDGKPIMYLDSKKIKRDNRDYALVDGILRDIEGWHIYQVQSLGANAEGLSHFKNVHTRGLCGIRRFVFTTGLIIGIDYWGYYGRYCFNSHAEAVSALEKWDGQGDPEGDWIKYKGESGERSNPKRPDFQHFNP